MKQIFLILAIPLLVASGCKPGNGTFENPNIILIMADDLGWGDTGYNGNEIIQTPFLDQMAMDGIRFDRFYSASAVCSPTRASVLTGRNPFRMGVFNANQGILRPEEITIPEILKEHGYMTGHFGKWHLGTLTHTERESNRGKPGNLKEYNPPALHGFDIGFSTEAKVPTWDPMKKPIKGVGSRNGWNSLEEDAPFEHYGTHYRDILGNKITENLEGDDSRVIMDRVLPFISGAKHEKKPFMAVVWFHTPHKPCVAGPEYREIYKEYDTATQNYAGSITAMDEQIGRLRSYLKEEGLEENTMIWFCSDNGPENNGPGSSGGFRDRKRSLHDGGIRVPGLLVWPGKIKTGFSSDEPCVTSDYLPTILDLLGENVEDWPYELDGTSLLPLIETGELDRTEALGFVFTNQTALIDQQYKVYSRNGVFSMYDMITDPKESIDISDTVSEVAESMTGDLKDWLENCKESFNGDEYGTESVDRLEQKWHNALKTK